MPTTARTPLIVNRENNHKGRSHTRNPVCIALENVTKSDVLETIAMMLMDQKRTKPHFKGRQTIALTKHKEKAKLSPI